MLFRANASNNNDEHTDREPCDAGAGKHQALDPRAEEDSDGQQQQQTTISSISRLSGVGSHRAPLPMATAQTSSKFHSLKRKLFPSRMRTALPARIPALITSPISVSAAADAGLDTAHRSNGNSNQDSPAAPEPQSTAYGSSHSRPMEPHHRVSITAAAIGNGDNDDDLELEMAIENLDADNGTEQDTLDEVSDFFSRGFSYFLFFPMMR